MTALSPGTKAPDFTLLDRDEQPRTLAAALQTGPVLLTFFKVSCPTCQYALPFIDRLHSQLEGTPVTVWAVSQDGPGATTAFNEEFEVSLTELFDPEEEMYPVSNAYGLTHVPTSFLIDRDGAIAEISVGWDKKDMEQISSRVGEAAGIADLTPFDPGEDVLDYRGG